VTIHLEEDADLAASAEGDAWELGGIRLTSRLLLGTGRFESLELMRQAVIAAKAECVTVAVRRERLYDSDGRNILEFLDTERLVLLPNTAGSFDAETAVRCARMGREILAGLNNPGQDWVKLEVLGDSRTLLPDSVETLAATERLVAEGFRVLCYTNDDPVVALKLQRAGAAAVMPAGSPIGSGQGVINRLNIGLIIEQLKADDPNYPVIVDAGIGTASDAAIAMELGADAVLVNSAIAQAGDPVGMARAMRAAVVAGRLAYRSRRMAKSRYGSASSPVYGTIPAAGAARRAAGGDPGGPAPKP